MVLKSSWISSSILLCFSSIYGDSVGTNHLRMRYSYIIGIKVEYLALGVNNECIKEYKDLYNLRRLTVTDTSS